MRDGAYEYLSHRVLHGAHKLALKGPSRRKTREASDKLNAHPRKQLPSRSSERIVKNQGQRHKEHVASLRSR
jgi:hypothetical protein